MRRAFLFSVLILLVIGWLIARPGYLAPTSAAQGLDNAQVVGDDSTTAASPTPLPAVQANTPTPTIPVAANA